MAASCQGQWNSCSARFHTGVEKDKAAAEGDFVHEWSQSQVEGQVNRLKLHKRHLYGRANFDLLEHRALTQV